MSGAQAVGVLTKATDPGEIAEVIRVAQRGHRVITRVDGTLDDVTGTRRLTTRERDTLALIGDGDTNAAIAATLLVSFSTVKLIVGRLLNLYGVPTRGQLAQQTMLMGPRRHRRARPPRPTDGATTEIADSRGPTEDHRSPSTEAHTARNAAPGTMVRVIVAAADGSSLSNPGPAGWAWFVDGDRWAAGGWKHATNNKAELMAVLDLLRQTRDAGDDLLVLCDSQYVINALTKWMPGWKRKGWKKADGKPVLNVDLLAELDRELAGRRVTFEWVKGHAGHDLNEAADARARAAATAYQQGTAVDAGPGFSAAAPRTPAPEASAPPQPDLAPRLFEAAPHPEPAPEEHAVVALQRRWLSDAVRSDRAAADTLLHPRFVEHDARGRASGKGRTLASLAPLADPVTVEVEGVDELAPWVILLRWRARSPSAASLRSSVWVKHDDTWRLRFEQQTPAVR